MGSAYDSLAVYNCNKAVSTFYRTSDYMVASGGEFHSAPGNSVHILGHHEGSLLLIFNLPLNFVAIFVVFYENEYK